jgi:hypothetical protein
VIDLVPAGEADGVPLYAPPGQALALQAVRGITWLVVYYPEETLRGLGLAAVAGLVLYFARDETPKPKARKPARRQPLPRKVKR